MRIPGTMAKCLPGNFGKMDPHDILSSHISSKKPGHKTILFCALVCASHWYRALNVRPSRHCFSSVPSGPARRLRRAEQDRALSNAGQRDVFSGSHSLILELSLGELNRKNVDFLNNRRFRQELGSLRH